MKFKQAIVLVAVSLFFVLAAQEASAYYHAPMGRWLTRDPFFTGSLQGKESLMGTPEYNNLYNYVTNSPTGSVDPSGLKKPNAVKSPCGTFSFEDYTDPGRPEPGYEVGFDPEGCPPCERGHIKLVQVIDPLGSGSTGPHFDVGKKAPPKGTK
jgi:RHS repeat-associated protein